MGKKNPENFTIGGILPLTQALNSHVSFRNHRNVRKSFLVQFLSKSTLDPSRANLHDPRGVRGRVELLLRLLVEMLYHLSTGDS